MKDYRKFCRPKTTKYPEIGDAEVKLNCGNTVYVKAKDYKKNFKINSVVGETTNTTGTLKVLDKALDKLIVVSPQTYVNNKDKFELVKIVNSIINDTSEQTGDIICHNSLLNLDAIFSYDNWLDVEDSWSAIGLVGIETFDNDDEVTEDRYVIMANGTTFIIKTTDYSKVSNEFEIVDTIEPLHEFEVWADNQCITRPIGEQDIVFVQINRNIGFDDATHLGGPDGIIIQTPTTDYPSDSYSIMYNTDFYSQESTDGYNKGDVVMLTSETPIDLTNATFSFGEVVE